MASRTAAASKQPLTPEIFAPALKGVYVEGANPATDADSVIRRIRSDMISVMGANSWDANLPIGPDELKKLHNHYQRLERDLERPETKLQQAIVVHLASTVSRLALARGLAWDGLKVNPRQQLDALFNNQKPQHPDAANDDAAIKKVDTAIDDNPEETAVAPAREAAVEIAEEPAAVDSAPADSGHAGKHGGRTGRQQRPEKKAANLTAEPPHKVFDRHWEALEAYSAGIPDGDANDITGFIASGPNEAIGLDAKTFKRKCDTARRTLGHVGADSDEALKLIDALEAAHASYDKKRQLSGVSKTGD